MKHVETDPSLQCSSFFLNINVKMAPGFNKNAIAAASTLITIAAARLVVASGTSSLSFSVAFKGC